MRRHLQARGVLWKAGFYLILASFYWPLWAACQWANAGKMRLKLTISMSNITIQRTRAFAHLVGGGFWGLVWHVHSLRGLCQQLSEGHQRSDWCGLRRFMISTTTTFTAGTRRARVFPPLFLMAELHIKDTAIHITYIAVSLQISLGVILSLGIKPT